MIHTGTRDGSPVERRRSSTQLVHNYKTPAGSASQSACRFRKFHEESRLTLEDSVRCTETRENAINRSESAFFGWYETSNLRKNSNETSLAEQSTFATHVWSTEEENSGCHVTSVMRRLAQRKIVGDKFTTAVSCVDTSMFALNDAHAWLAIGRAVQNSGSRVSSFGRSLSQRAKRVQHGRCLRSSSPEVPHGIELCKNQLHSPCLSFLLDVVSPFKFLDKLLNNRSSILVHLFGT
jgi:hypothetical protein